MHVTERINLLLGHCREAHYPEALINTLEAYLSGQGSLAEVQQAWQAAHPQGADLPPSFSTLSGDHTNGLDELDARRLNICIATDHLDTMLENLTDDAPIEALARYLQKLAGQQQHILEYLIDCYEWMDDDKPTPLGRLLLCYLPEHFAALLPLMKQKQWNSEYEEFLELLMSAQPPYVDLAWQTVQQASQGDLGYCAAPLLKADPARFRAWVQQIASPNGPGNEYDQFQALVALFDYDFAHNIDLAVTVASGKRTFSNGWHTSQSQQRALRALYPSNPTQYLYLVDEAIISKDYYLYDAALDLLENADLEQALPVLQHAVAAGTALAAERAAERLLKAEWAGRQEYAISLLAHRSRQVRNLALEWLHPQGEALLEQVSPLLTDKSAYARLSAVQILAHLGGERAHALLAARRDVEKAISVKQAIVDAIGLPEPPADLDPATAIADIQAEAAKAGKKSPLSWFKAGEASGLQWVNGDAVPPSVINYLLACQARMRQMQLEMNVRRALAWIDRQTAGALAHTLFTGWVKQGCNAKESWCLPLVAVLADDRLIQPLRRQIDTLSRKSKRRAMAVKCVLTLALLGSDLALNEVIDLTRQAKSWQVQQAARQAFADAASRQHVSHEELADRIVPRLGFNEQGEQILDYGPRQFTARLGFDLTVQLKDSSGKRLTLLPRPNARDDAAKVAAAQAAWQVLKKYVAPAAKLQGERLENALAIQRCWSVARWRELFLRHPLLRALAISLVWGVLAPGEAGYQMIFRPLEDGSLTNADDEACLLPADGKIRLAHPIELDEAARSAWLQHLSDYEITPPFPQLNRPIITVDETASNALFWQQHQGYRVAGKLFKERYERSNWAAPEEESGENYNLIWKAFPNAGIEALLEISYLTTGYERSWPTTLIRLAFGRAGTAERIKQATAAALENDDDNAYDYYRPYKIDEAALLKLAEVPPVVFSEAAANVQSFAALGHYDPDWQQKIEEAPDDDLSF